MIGQTVGKYRVEERIGRGGMGTVYRAVDETLRREVAIKVLNSELNDPEVAKRFRAEAITVARLNHAGIATVYELFEHDGQWLMVMEFVRGETLERLIERAGPLSAERAAELCMQALAALTHAHGLGVVHRDLKPANLMLTDTGVVKIMDFGIARVSGSEHLTSAGFMMGTPAYMAPEQVLGHEVDARTDIYAMGVVMYRLTTAKLPFKGETPFALAQSQVNDPPTPVRTAREGLPPWLEMVLSRALAKAPVERFQTALEFLDALKLSLAGLPIPSLFDTTAQTGMLRTPSGLPSGAFGVTVPGMSGSTAQTMMAGTGASPSPVPPTGMMPTPTGSVAVASGSTGAVQTGTTGVSAQVPVAALPAPPKPAAKMSTTTLAGIAAGVVILAVAGYFITRPSAPLAPEQPAVTTPAPDAQSGTPPPATAASTEPPPAGGTPPVTPPPGATGATGAAGQTPPPVTQPAGAAGANPPATSANAAAPGANQTPAGAAAPGARGAAAPAVPPPAAAARGDAGRAGARATTPPTPADVADTVSSFPDAKLLTFEGAKGREPDVIIHYGSGKISVIPKKGGLALAEMPYKAVLHATYMRTKDPKGHPSLPSILPENYDIPGFRRGARNWLVLQSKTDTVIVYLNDSTVTEVLRTFEARTLLKIDRPLDTSK